MPKNATWQAILTSYEGSVNRRKNGDKALAGARSLARFLCKVKPTEITTEDLNRYHAHLQRETERDFKLVLGFVKHIGEFLNDRL